MTGPAGIVALDAVALGQRIRTRQVSVTEVMAEYLDRIERLNGAVNAIVALRERETLLAEAAAADQRLAAGEAPGPLFGFPLAVKDLQPTHGIRTTFGSPIYRDHVPAADSIMVERLRAAGAIIIGKTNTPEFGLGSHTYNPVYGATRNPYDLSKTAGGSSGGAAVALALHMLPVADGSDYGGSLRNPAGWNNVYGLRPSLGRVPSGVPDGFLPSMGVDGPMARNPADLALLLSVQAGYDPRVPLSLSEDPARFTGSLERDLTGVRIAWGGDFGGAVPVEPEVLEVCRDALRVFEAMGCVVEEAFPDYPVDEVWRAWVTLRAWQVGGRRLAEYADPAKRALMKPELIFEIESGMKLGAFDLTAAASVRSAWYEAVVRFFTRYDYLVLPTAQLFPFDIDLTWPREVAGRRMATYHEWLKLMIPGTMSGCPCLAAPAGFGAAGLPIGIQIMGRNRDELGCLQLAHAYDRATAWPQRRPPALALNDSANPG